MTHLDVHNIDFRRSKQNGKRDPSDRFSNSDAREYDDEQAELLTACARYRQVNDESILGPTDVLWIMKKLGWTRPKRKHIQPYEPPEPDTGPRIDPALLRGRA